jgi:hypothetical protein
MTPYVSRYRRIWVIAYSLVRPWSCVEGRVRKSTACSSFGSGSGNPRVFRGRSLLCASKSCSRGIAIGRRPFCCPNRRSPVGLVVLLSGALWNRRKESDDYVVILRKARRSRQTPNAGLYQSRQRAHRRAPRRPNNGPHGGWREGLHRHNAGNAYRRCPSCGSCVGFALTLSPSATKLDTKIRTRRLTREKAADFLR